MQFAVIAVGRVRDAGLSAACDDYLNRIRRYLRIDVKEVGAARTRRAGDVRRLEGERLVEAIPKRARAVALTRVGRHFDSQGFAERLSIWRRDARDVVFVVGGADGLDAAVLARCEMHLSLSPMTLPHELARVVLLEQLYRACTILQGEPYHKGNPS